MNPLASLFGGGLSAGGGGPSTSGAADAGLTASGVNSFQYTSPFIVAGHGSNVSAPTSAALTPSANAAAGVGSNIPVYIAIGVAALVAITALLRVKHS